MLHSVIMRKLHPQHKFYFFDRTKNQISEFAIKFINSINGIK